MLFFLLLKRKKKVKFESETESIPGYGQDIQQKTAQQPQIRPKLQSQSYQQITQPQRQMQSSQPPSPQKLCTTCRQQLTFMPRKERYYCYQCDKYD